MGIRFYILVMFGLLQGSINGIFSEYKPQGSPGTLGGLVAVFVNITIGVTFGISLVGIAYSFVQFVISKGDKDALSKAKTALTWSVVALLLTFFVVLFKNLLLRLLGIDDEFNII